jgi:hypothetical protein
MLRPLRGKPNTCVVVSYWMGRPAKRLHGLLAQMQKVDAGVPFDLVVVCNGGDERPLSLPRRFDDLRPIVLNRENCGFNLGAWEHGWRSVDGYEFFLFLQDDCFLKQAGWVYDFEFRITHDRGIGLLGEMVVYDQMTWDYIREVEYTNFWPTVPEWPEPVHPIDTYKTLFDRHGIPWKNLGNHTPSIILFTSRRILEEVGGIPYFGPSYREAIAGELAISRLIESRGYRIAKVKDQPFELIGHPQWSPTGIPRTPGLRGSLFEAWWKLKSTIRRTLGLKRKARRPGIAHREK